MKHVLDENFKVRNVPGYEKGDRGWWIIRKIKDEYWFYGSFNTIERASECKNRIGRDAFVVNPKFCDRI